MYQTSVHFGRRTRLVSPPSGSINTKYVAYFQLDHMTCISTCSAQSEPLETSRRSIQRRTSLLDVRLTLPHSLGLVSRTPLAIRPGLQNSNRLCPDPRSVSTPSKTSTPRSFRGTGRGLRVSGRWLSSRGASEALRHAQTVCLVSFSEISFLVPTPGQSKTEASTKPQEMYSGL